MECFKTTELPAGESYVFARVHGEGPPLLLLHGFPETSLMWRKIAPLLARDFTVVCADLPGYGQSGCPRSGADHEAYSKRSMARALVGMMEHLGFPRFSVCGHDRGGRVAYRMALDHPERVDRLAVLDVLPTETVWERADAGFALSFWPWSLLAQPEPLPERVLATAGEAIVDAALTGWGTPEQVFPAEVRSAYVQPLIDPAHAHAICEEYRAAATVDRQHDRDDRALGRRIRCPVFVMWSKTGGLERWYRDDSGPLSLWRDWALDVEGHALDAGHFFPEEAPKETAGALAGFFKQA